MWLWTRQEAKKIDELSIAGGIPAEKLMETAGSNSAAEILKIAPQARTAVVLCGPGHNGGDAFVVARELHRQGLQVLAVDLEGPSPLRQKKKSEYQGSLISASDFLKRIIPTADLWVDGLFGIGLSRKLEGEAFQLIQRTQSQTGRRIALDTPSGLDVDTGKTQGICFAAHDTLTVGAPKPGFYLNQGPQFCGRIRVIDAGFDRAVVRSTRGQVFLMTPKWVSRWLPERQATDNKSQGGRSLILAGSSEMPGAALLACEAASRVGSGYVYSQEKEVLRFRPEVIPWTKADWKRISAVLIGPGLGTGPETQRLLESLRQSKLPTVIDADALTVASREAMSPFPANWIATPHAGELSRMMGMSAMDIEADRLRAARLAQQKWQSVILLKGFHTVVAYPKLTVIVPTGNVALAKGGSGDVLAGMIVGLLSQGVSLERAPLIASFVHGWMADQWVREGKDKLSLTPQDLLLKLPESLKRFRQPETIAMPHP
jgi:hydroxyethylthiazole kinase-like uncharacterized protein yjeF